jgi:hypothetical protein
MSFENAQRGGHEDTGEFELEFESEARLSLTADPYVS